MRGPKGQGGSLPLRKRNVSTSRGVYPPTAMTQTFPFPSLPLPSLPLSLSLPFPFPSLPSLPSPGSGVDPPEAGIRGLPRKIEIEIGFGEFWRIFVSKRQLHINIQIRAKRGLINYVWPIYLGEFFPLQGVISSPEPNLDASCVHSPL